MIHNILFFIGVISLALTMVTALIPERRSGGFESLSENIIWFDITCFIAAAVAKYLGW